MVPSGATVALSLGSATDFKLQILINDVPDTIDCPELRASVETPKDGLTAPSRGVPAFPEPCPDGIGGVDHVTASGSWSLSLNKTGTSGSLNVPEGGASVTFNVLPSCSITLSPSGETHLDGSYNGADALTISDAKVSASGSGCTVGRPVSVSATIVLKPEVRVEH
jgi:hypothetical protein